LTNPNPHRFSLEGFRRQLASVDALPQLCVLGVISGIITGCLMTLFRLLLRLGAMVFMPDSDPEAFEQLTPTVRALLPLLAVTLIGGWLAFQPVGTGRQMGVAHVIERLTYHQGRFPLRNWITQWWVGLVSVLGGLSAGREGPAIHLGAAACSGLGMSLKLPHNSLRVLVACGTAAGISASFNTPLAGVIFAMEVVMMEYTIMGFMPVILASIMGSVISQSVFGFAPPFQQDGVVLGSFVNLPWIAASALLIGLLAGGFVRLARSAPRLDILPFSLRLLLVGVAVGVTALWYPEVQGMGYDNMHRTLQGEVAVDVLLAIALGKLVLTAGAVACRVPVSIIGPILVAGGAAGALCGILGALLLPNLAADPALYALMGMAAMMAAVLQAPLAALMALLELTHNPQLMLPGMLAVVVACLTARQLCACDGFFISVTRHGLHPLQQPLMQALNRISVPAVMERNLTRTRRLLTYEQASALLEANPEWIVIERSSDDKPALAMKAADLARWLLEHTEDDELIDKDGMMDLLEIPGQRLDLSPIHLQATLSEAYERLNEDLVDALYVVHGRRPNQKRISGIITRDAIERYYRYNDHSPG
jgi:H+/Cl- antiporter ClcA